MKPGDPVGIVMWFKHTRTTFTQRDKTAMTWWLERHAGLPVKDASFMLLTNIDPRDPLSCRTYYGDRSWRAGAYDDGQLRVGGGVKGKLIAQ